ncbi:hypothetical protein EW146_g3895 [Bondarzewia mesenterica]|uniref:Uncharacterized protein n=1 Tax=Bondarzewia mesenterica TaxID=1095465 RepID=A0A4S4LW70_9AGAM|nr:hypothetical protein EW146_g3895 [Bondarzewia mesenterica]
MIPEWKKMIQYWSGTIAVGTVGQKTNEGVTSVCWALSRNQPLNPFIVFCCTSLLYVVDVRLCQIVGYLRGHGGAITSITAHPTTPDILCTTARDFTARIYDLTLNPTQEPNNPEWMPGTGPSRAGAAHGLHMTEPEGKGIGRCVVVLCGGRSGGHQSVVHDAAFHPLLPLIATCGMDRAVKIWRLPPSVEGENPPIQREDKPLFSSSCVHKARVLSINWVSHDILVTHSAPAPMRREESDEWYEEPGTMVLWKWLSTDRFFPPNQPFQEVLRGCAADYQDSASFKILSSVSLPYPPPSFRLSIYRSVDPVTGLNVDDPLILLPLSNTLRIINVCHLSPREPPPFPLDEPEVVMMTKRMRLEEPDQEEREDLGTWQEDLGWKIVLGAPGEQEVEEIEAANMGLDGRVIAAVGRKGSLWIWVDSTS